MDLAKAARKFSMKLNLVSGKKPCPTCRTRISEALDELDLPELENIKTSSDEDMATIEKSVSLEKDRGMLADCFSSIGLSPRKLHAQPTSSKV